MPLDVDSEGFLRDLSCWNKETAATLAAQDAIDLTPAHWEVILLARDYYQQYRITPPTRVLVKLLQEAQPPGNPDTPSSIHLMRLFTGRPMTVLSRIAGLPRPVNCKEDGE